MKSSFWFIPVFLLLVLGLPIQDANAQGFSRVIGFTSSWDKIFSTARSQSLGGSDLATLKGPTSVLENPGMIFEKGELALGYDSFDYVIDTKLRNYGIAFSTNELTIFGAKRSVSMPAMLVRTAYNPEGTGETFNYAYQVVVLGINYNLIPRLFSNSTTQWSVGFSHRRSTYTFNDDSDTQGDLDIGSTIRFRRPMAEGQLDYGLAMSLRNLMGNNVGDTQNSIPKYFQYGGFLEIGLGLGRFPHDGLSLAVSLARIQPDTRVDLTHLNYGFEIVVYHLLALRTGYDDMRYGGVDARGAGILLGEFLPGPLDFRVDYSSMEPGTISNIVDDRERLDSFSINAVWDF